MKTFRFKISNNLVLQIDHLNYISANQIVDQLMNYEGFTLKKDNVMKSIDNLLYNNYPIEAAYYDCLTGEVVLELSDEEFGGEEYEYSEV